jgi:DNA adenine methylase
MAANRAVEPTRPPAPYMGGKRRLASRLVSLIAATPHSLYAEPFVGMGGVFFRRRAAADCEVINDASRDVATFFRVLQRHYAAFMEMLRFQLSSRAEFERLVATNPDTLTDLERSARFLYLQRVGWGGKVTGRTFGPVYAGSARFNLLRVGPLLEDVHSRLAGVVIECLPWRRFLAQYDRPGALFYLDPPYWGCEADYGPLFGREDFQALAAALADLRGRFILSLNDTPEVRATFAAFDQQVVEVTWSVGGGAGKRVGELIISGGGGDG